MNRNIELIGVPVGFGGVEEGCENGPDAVRAAGLVEEELPYDDDIREHDANLFDYGNISFEFESEHRPENLEDLVPNATMSEIVSEHAIDIDKMAQAWAQTADVVERSVEDGNVPLVIGGDHTIATGTLMGVSQKRETGVIWFDSHADFNIPRSSPSGNLHGMPLAAALGRGRFDSKSWARAPNLSPENVVLIGLRDIDHSLPDGQTSNGVVSEAEALSKSDMTVFTMSDIIQQGLRSVVEDAIEIATGSVDQIHVSVDLDWLDSKEVPGVGTPVDRGVSRQEAQIAMDLLHNYDAKHDLIGSMEFVEVNPQLDIQNETANAAVELARVLLGSKPQNGSHRPSFPGLNGAKHAAKISNKENT